MKQILKRITVTILIIMMFCTPKASFAADEGITVESARRQIAEWGLNFKMTEGQKWVYSISFPLRGATYIGGYPQDKYTFDCVGCVSYILHYSIGINYSGAVSGNSGFVTPQNNVRDTSHFELHYISGSDQPQIGDVLITTKGEGGSTRNHVAIYCGGGKLADCTSSRSTTINTVNTSNWSDSTGHKYTKFARLISVSGASFSPIEGGVILPTPGADGVEEVDLDEVAERFKYHGMPTKIDYQREETDIFRWIFDGLTGLGDFLAGLIISIIRVPVVGLTSIVEANVNKGIHWANE